MNTQIQYEKYKKPLKVYCIVQLAASAAALVAVIFILFLPNFSISLTQLAENFADGYDTILPKLKDIDPALLLQKDPHIYFSVFDELYAGIAPAAEGAVTYTLLVGYLQILGVLFLVVGAIFMIVSLVRNIMHITSIDGYAINEYDNIKRRIDTGKRNRWNYFTSPAYWFAGGAIYEILVIVIGNMFKQYGDVLTSYFMAMTGLSVGGVFTILISVAAVGGFIAAFVLHRRIKTAIIREDYRINDNTGAPYYGAPVGGQYPAAGAPGNYGGYPGAYGVAPQGNANAAQSGPAAVPPEVQGNYGGYPGAYGVAPQGNANAAPSGPAVVSPEVQGNYGGYPGAYGVAPQGNANAAPNGPAAVPPEVPGGVPAGEQPASKAAPGDPDRGGSSAG